MTFAGGDASGVAVLARTAAVVAISSITQIALTIAFTSLVFRGSLVGDLPLGLTATFAGLVISGVVVAVRSDLPGHLAGPQDGGMVLISTMVPAIVATTSAPGPTVLVLMALGSVTVGVTMFTLGALGLGRLVRYLPFPVMAGFLAGTGLVIGRATIELLDGGIAGDATGGSDRVVRILIGTGTSVAMVTVARSRLRTERMLPVLVLGMVTLVHVGLMTAGLDRGDGARRGFLLPELPPGALLSSESLRFVLDADWGTVADQAIRLLPLLILAPLTLLLYLGALEASLDTDLDTNREFRITGSVNVAAGVVAAPPAYTQFAATMLIQRMAGGRRIVPAMVAMSGALVIALGDRIVALVPQPVVAGLLGFIALSFVIDWLGDTIDRMTRIEWAMAAAIALSILVFGFLPGVGLGIALTAASFVIQYSRMSGVRRIRTGTHLRSNVERGGGQDAVLERTGDDVVVAEPEGFLFFGTGDSITRQVTTRADDRHVHFVIIDFSLVTGADSSAAAALGQLARWARQSGVELIWCGLRPSVRRALRSLIDGTDTLVELPDLDRALERTERARLADQDAEAMPEQGIRDQVPELETYGHTVTFAAGDPLFARGEPGPGLVVVESGWAEVIGAPGARRRRVGPGSVLGEIGLVNDGTATATVVAETDVTALVLDRAAAEVLAAEQPRAAASLYRHVARSLSARLLRSDAEVASFAYGHTDTTAPEQVHIVDFGSGRPPARRRRPI